MILFGRIRGPFDGPNARALRAWIEAHMPELDAALGPLGRGDVLRKLNELTGLDVQGSDSIEATCPRFLEELQAQQERRADD